MFCNDKFGINGNGFPHFSRKAEALKFIGQIKRSFCKMNWYFDRVKGYVMEYMVNYGIRIGDFCREYSCFRKFLFDKFQCRNFFFSKGLHYSAHLCYQMLASIVPTSGCSKSTQKAIIDQYTLISCKFTVDNKCQCQEKCLLWGA